MYLLRATAHWCEHLFCPVSVTTKIFPKVIRKCLVTSWKKKQANDGKKLARKAKTLSTHNYRTSRLKFLFRELRYPVLELYTGFLDVFTLKNNTCFSDSYSYYTNWFFGWFGSRKAECGHQQFVTPYLEFIRTLHQDTKTACIKDGLLCKMFIR